LHLPSPRQGSQNPLRLSEALQWPWRSTIAILHTCYDNRPSRPKSDRFHRNVCCPRRLSVSRAPSTISIHACRKRSIVEQTACRPPGFALNNPCTQRPAPLRRRGPFTFELEQDVVLLVLGASRASSSHPWNEARCRSLAHSGLLDAALNIAAFGTPRPCADSHMARYRAAIAMSMSRARASSPLQSCRISSRWSGRIRRETRPGAVRPEIRVDLWRQGCATTGSRRAEDAIDQRICGRCLRLRSTHR
jgi:hypothetical protein